jgi:DNA-binding CsgD family transcriptional regulator
MAAGSEEDRLIRLVGEIYEAATDPERMANMVDVLMEGLGIESGVAFITNHKTGKLVHFMGASANFDAASRAIYQAHYHDQNPWYQSSTNRNGLYVKHGAELIEQREFEKTEFRADWCRRVGIYHMIGGTAPIRNDLAVAIGVHKPLESAMFDERQKHVFTLLMQHVVRSCQLAERIGTLQQTAALSLEMLAGLEAGVVILDGGCQPVNVNAVAERLLRSSRWLTYSAGTVRPVHPHSRHAFEARVAMVAKASGNISKAPGGVLLLLDPIDPPLAVSVLPFQSQLMGLGAERKLVALVFADPDTKTSASIESLIAAFGLTSAEARLAAALIAGRSLVDAATALGISINTAKTQLKSVFVKTGCKRQADLAALALRNPALRLARQGFLGA